MRSPKDTMNRRVIALAAFAITAAFDLPFAAAMAETVEVAPGVTVTKKIYGGADSEAPFYGFADNSPILRQADDISVSIAVQLYGSRAKAFEALAKRGWEALEAADFKQATARFNQVRNHNPAGACLAADQADKLEHATHAHTSIRWIWREAKCSGH